MGKKKVGDREEFARFVCGLPQIRGRFETVVPLITRSGEGQNSLVLRALDGRRPIILKVDLPWNNSYRRSAFEREYEILSRFKGEEGIVEVLGEMEEIQLQVRAEEDGIPLPYVIRYFTMEMARQDLAEVIYSEKERKKLLNKIILFRAACRSVRRLHSNSICHRDLKPSNLLIFGENNVKLGDLGTARQLGEGVQGILDTYDFPRGDVRYTALELLCVARECDEGFLDGDFYSLGAILFELVTGRVFSEVVYSLEYIKALAAAFSTIKSESREYMFGELLPDIIESHPIPSLSEITRDVPGSVARRLDIICRGLTDPKVKNRLKNFDEVFRHLEIITRILSWEEKSGRPFGRRM